ncbi:hypothetical protein SLI_6895 [Streptomyces lividans 1326]|uniref:Uncharacterized protein n=1 Tax=Streptomyces lividans 1326 TaxID=1200984 RepID=A0A7U9DYM6_STRLI|nr:hypothetical protein SLI_6895 [Streptomyces lividans 1326]
MGLLLPAVGASDVGAGVGQVLLGPVEDDAGDETAAVDAGVLPGVAVGGDVRPRRRRRRPTPRADCPPADRPRGPAAR